MSDEVRLAEAHIEQATIRARSKRHVDKGAQVLGEYVEACQRGAGAEELLGLKARVMDVYSDMLDNIADAHQNKREIQEASLEP